MSRHRQAIQAAQDDSDSAWSTPEELRLEPVKKPQPLALRGAVRASPTKKPKDASKQDDSQADSPDASPLRRTHAAAAMASTELLNLEGERFPSYDELKLLPPEIRDTLLSLVTDFFRQRIYPRLVLNLRRRKRRELVNAARSMARYPTVSVSFLQQNQFFSRWSNHDQIISKLELKIYDKDELITHEGDVTQSGILFLVHGTMQGRRKRKQQAQQPKSRYSATPSNKTSKSLADAFTDPTQTYEAMSVYGEMIFLTEQPRLESLRALTTCAIYSLSKERFFDLLQSLPSSQQQHIIDHAYAQRRENILRVFPMNAARLKTAHLFSHVPEDQLNGLAPKMEPRAYPANHTLCKHGDNGVEIFYIVRGTVCIMTTPPDQTHRESDDGADRNTGPVQVGPGAIVGEMSGLFMQKRAITVITITPVDLYSFTREQIQSAIPNTALTNEMLTRAHKQQAERQAHMRNKYSRAIAEIPFAKQCAPPAMLAALSDAFSEKVYAPGSTILSVSGCADRLIIVTRGRARLTSNGQDLQLEECLGYTCLVPHRWQYCVVAQETLETFELPYAAYGRICKKFGVYEEIRELTMGLLYPRVHPQSFQKALPYLKNCRNPPCFPSSQEYEVKPFAARVVDKPTFQPAIQKRQKNENGGQFATGPMPKLPPIHFAPVDQSNAFDDPETNPDSSDLQDENSTSMSRRHQREEASKRRKEREKHWTSLASPPRKTEGKDNQAEIERLSKKIRDLQLANATNKASVTKPHKLSPLKTKTSQNTTAEHSPTRKREPWQTRTIAIQTPQSFLKTRARILAARGRGPEPDLDDPEEVVVINDGNDAVGVRAFDEASPTPTLNLLLSLDDIAMSPNLKTIMDAHEEEKP